MKEADKQEKMVSDLVDYFSERDKQIIVIIETDRGSMIHGKGFDEWIVFWCTKMANSVINKTN